MPNKSKKYALSALAILLPLPSIGVVFGMILFPNTLLGQLIFGLCKIAILLFPLLWHLWINRQPLRVSAPNLNGFAIALSSGLLISLSILVCFLLIRDSLIDIQNFKYQMAQIGLNKKSLYLAGALYWIVINALLEEYVWRWFVVQEAMKIAGKYFAIFVSAIGFTAHHIIAMQLYFPWLAVLLACAGIFTGALIWSWIYVRYRSIWPAYLSHALVDTCIFSIGYYMIFVVPER